MPTENLKTKIVFKADPFIKDNWERLLIKGRALMNVLTTSPDTLAQACFTVHQTALQEVG